MEILEEEKRRLVHDLAEQKVTPFPAVAKKHQFRVIFFFSFPTLDYYTSNLA